MPLISEYIKIVPLFITLDLTLQPDHDFQVVHNAMAWVLVHAEEFEYISSGTPPLVSIFKLTETSVQNKPTRFQNPFQNSCLPPQLLQSDHAAGRLQHEGSLLLI